MELALAGKSGSTVVLLTSTAWGHWTQCKIQLFLFCFSSVIEARYTCLPPCRVVNNQGDLPAYHPALLVFIVFLRAQHSWKDVFDYLVILSSPLSSTPHPNYNLHKERHFHLSCLSSTPSSHHGPWHAASALYIFVA